MAFSIGPSSVAGGSTKKSKRKPHETPFSYEYKDNDNVVRARKYSEDVEFYNGGVGGAIPIGTIGIITDDEDDTELSVMFSNGICYSMHHKELCLVKHWGKIEPKSKKSLIKYKPGSSIKSYIKQILRVEKDKTRLKWLRTFDNCVLPDDVKVMIDEALTVVLRADVFEKWGINDHFEKGLTNSILLYGPPGTGKTMVSESIASILGKNLMKLNNADIQSNVPGRTEKNMTESFKKAKDEDAVILLDECDSLLYDRNAVGAILSAEINHLLMEIENFDGIVILTTNRLHKLDEALQRRIVAKIELPLPNEKARREIWKKLIPPKMPTDKLDYNKLAKSELSGGDIKNAVLLGARKAVANNEDKVTMKSFEKVIAGIVKNKEIFKSVKPKPYKTATHSDIMDRVKGKDKVL